jgi:hypothetical protein
VHAADADFFSYTARLKVDGAIPRDSFFDLRFSFFDVRTGGSPLDQIEVQAVTVDTNGFFTIQFNTSDTWSSFAEVQWIEVAARRAGGTSNYTILMPRQHVSPVPKAIHSRTADTALNLTGTLPVTQLPASVARLDTAQTFAVAPLFNSPTGPPFMVGVTQHVANLNADLLDGLDATAFWRRQTIGDARGIIEPEDRPVEIRAGNYANNRLLRLQPGYANLGSSLIGGSIDNSIVAGVPGSVIAGGRGNLVESNADYSFLGGGDGNQILKGARNSTIAGGARQLIGPNSSYAGIFAGYGNVLSSNSPFGGVLVGNNGKVRENSDFSVVFSGENNSIGPQAKYSAVLAGGANQIQSGADVSLIGSGQQNTIHSNAALSAVVSGQLNQIRNGASRSFVGGGDYNEIGPQSYEAFLGGGTHNRIEYNAPYSAILGGYYNVIRSNASGAVVLGGVSSVAGAPSAIAAGRQARAEHSGSIVLADGQYADFMSTRPNEFSVRAGGGVRFETGGAGLNVDGVKLTGGGGGLVLGASSVNASNLVDGAALAELVDDDGAGSGLDADRLDGLSSDDFWRLAGNAGTSAGANFLGTTDDEPLEIKVNNLRALRIEPTAGSPNLIGGWSGNSVSAGVGGATISGGGSPGLFGVALPNRVTDNFGVVGGGFQNVAGSDNANGQDSLGATVGGGLANIASAETAFIGGGTSNTVQAVAGAISGGQRNTIQTNSETATIGGGFLNTVESNSPRSTIGGGEQNRIKTNASHGTTSGGAGNLIQSRAHYASVGGGFSQTIREDAYAGTIGGGANNVINTNATYATVPGGAYAYARDYGQLAYASGSFAGNGDAQTSIHVLRGTTQGTAPAELFLDGIGQRMKVPPGAVWTFDILVVASSAEPGFVAGYQIRGMAANLFGVTAELGPLEKTVFRETLPAWDVVVEGDDLHSALVIRAMGTSSTGKPVRWVASVRTVEVIF